MPDLDSKELIKIKKVIHIKKTSIESKIKKIRDLIKKLTDKKVEYEEEVINLENEITELNSNFYGNSKNHIASNDQITQHIEYRKEVDSSLRNKQELKSRINIKITEQDSYIKHYQMEILKLEKKVEFLTK